MRELQLIVEAWAELAQSNTKAALATVVQVEGSAYRRAGARLLVAEDGCTWGGISGGCLEADVVLRAQMTMQEGQPSLACYDTRNDADLYFGVGLGCNGLIYILIEPLAVPASAAQAAQLAFLQGFLQGRDQAALTVVYRSSSSQVPVGAHCWLRHDGAFHCDTNEAQWHGELLQATRSALCAERSVTQTLSTADGTIEVFSEALLPPPSLVIFGAGHDAVPLVRGAKELGWTVTVADHRPTCATAERFPAADKVVLAEATTAFQRASIDGRTGTLLMTHNYLHDLELLPLLLRSTASYVGVLGPHRRTERMLDDLKKQGQEFSAEQLARLHAPVGLDLGAETPAEIALAILAEMQAVFAQRRGGFLRERRGRIHAHD